MAFTVVRKNHNVGDLRMIIMSCTADAATQAIETGLSVIYAAPLIPISMATSTSHFVRAGVGAAGTSIASMVAVTGIASADVFYILAFGK